MDTLVGYSAVQGFEEAGPGGQTPEKSIFQYQNDALLNVLTPTETQEDGGITYYLNLFVNRPGMLHAVLIRLDLRFEFLLDSVAPDSHLTQDRLCLRIQKQVQLL